MVRSTLPPLGDASKSVGGVDLAFGAKHSSPLGLASKSVGGVDLAFSDLVRSTLLQVQPRGASVGVWQS